MLVINRMFAPYDTRTLSQVYSLKPQGGERKVAKSRLIRNEAYMLQSAGECDAVWRWDQNQTNCAAGAEIIED